MLVTGLAEQAPRSKRIDTLTLPLASFSDPLIAGVMPIKCMQNIVIPNGQNLNLRQEE